MAARDDAPEVLEEEFRFRRVDLERFIVRRDLWLPSNMAFNESQLETEGSSFALIRCFFETYYFSNSINDSFNEEEGRRIITDHSRLKTMVDEARVSDEIS